MADVLGPGREQAVHLQQAVDLPSGLTVTGGDLDDEFAVHGAEEPLDLASALRAPWGGVHQLDAEFRAGPQQPRVDEREQIRFAAGDHWPVQGIAGPQLVGAVGLEPSEDRRRGRGLQRVQPLTKGSVIVGRQRP
ncbi:hypothetical protein [Streptomyces inhibens]|uniref:hypothetical protein n=1 Tax=Streptomyces inhibens TaxID=2293571 RepID=UPI00315A4CBD